MIGNGDIKMRSRWVFAGLGAGLLLTVCVLLNTGVLGEIHRARSNLKVKVTPRVFPPAPSPTADILIEDGEEASGHSFETWVYSIIAAILIGLSGIFPLLVIPLESGKALREGAGARRLQLLLSFAVGSLLGDVFLHLLPEVWTHVSHENAHEELQNIGLWVLLGLFTFLIIEKLFAHPEEPSPHTDNDESNIVTPPKKKSTANGKQSQISNGSSPNQTSKKRHKSQKGKKSAGDVIRDSNGVTPANNTEEKEEQSQIKITGWLNLLANVIDNFTHGLAVAASYCISTKVGLVTTMAILLHEIPHEVSDFAILLRSGFDRWRAAKAQVLTASGGVIGALVALTAESTKQAGDRTAWVLPFTSGGFLYIALVNVMPDLLQETSARESCKHVVLVLCGVMVMGLVTFCVE